MLIVAVLFLLVLLRWGLLVVGAALVIPRIRSCPACFADTVPVRRRWLRAVLPWLQWRWCPTCGWEGPSSRAESELVPGPGRRRAHGLAPRRSDAPSSLDGPRGPAPEEWKTGR